MQSDLRRASSTSSGERAEPISGSKRGVKNPALRPDVLDPEYAAGDAEVTERNQQIYRKAEELWVGCECCKGGRSDEIRTVAPMGSCPCFWYLETEYWGFKKSDSGQVYGVHGHFAAIYCVCWRSLGACVGLASGFTDVCLTNTPMRD